MMRLAYKAFYRVRAMATMAVKKENVKRKITGRAFYESIGSPKVVLAPMVDQSEFVSILLWISLYCTDLKKIFDRLCSLSKGLEDAYEVVRKRGLG